MSRSLDPVKQSVLAAFTEYEDALVRNDVSAMDAWFLDHPTLVRYGIAEVQHGFSEIARWRATAMPVPKNRQHEQVTVTVLNDDVAVVALEFRNGTSPGLGRQSQVWQRVEGAWRIMHAHVSMLPE